MGKVNKAILDTNILQYGVSRTLHDEVADLLPKITKLEIDLVISSFSVFEVYRGLSKSKIPVTRELVASITALESDYDTHRIAAVLYSCYQFHESTKGRKYEDGDIIIGATAIQYNSAILTANVNDFPRPFFVEAESYIIERSSDKAEIHIQLLKPDIRLFNQTMKNCLL